MKLKKKTRLKIFKHYMSLITNSKIYLVSHDSFRRKVESIDNGKLFAKPDVELVEVRVPPINIPLFLTNANINLQIKFTHERICWNCLQQRRNGLHYLYSKNMFMIAFFYFQQNVFSCLMKVNFLSRYIQGCHFLM